MISKAHPAVVRNAPVKYRRDMTGISMYLNEVKDKRRLVMLVNHLNRVIVGRVASPLSVGYAIPSRTRT